jgi:hypothetical protein
MPKSRIHMGPKPHDICEIQMLRPRLLTSDDSEMYVHDAGTPTPTDIPVTRKPASSMGKLKENMTSRTPVI